MSSRSMQRFLRFAAALAIVSLAMMIWAIHDSGVVPVMIFMTLGQALGTASLIIYLFVLVKDTRRRLRESGRTILESIAPEDTLDDPDNGDEP